MATNTYVALDKVTVSGTSTGTITFSSIPSTYTDLVLISNLTSSAQVGCQLTINSTTSGYSTTQVYGSGSAASSNRSSSMSYINYAIGYIDTLTTIICNFMNYSNTTTYKTMLLRKSNGSTAASTYVSAETALWSNTSAINRIDITLASGYFVAGSTFSLYGIKAQPAFTTKATGGTIVQAADGYVYHTFTSSGTFTPSQALTCDYLVVAGGGGGGTNGAGGGGAGGYLTASGFSAASGTGYTVTIGAGGAGSGSGTASGTSGNNSVFSSITSTGGGGGGSAGGTSPGLNGGSGGGEGSSDSGFGSASPSGQGNNGGQWVGGSDSGAGGGGAGAVGANNSATGGGVGGAGLAPFGASTYYAGGGGGGGRGGSNPGGAGGVGGGGAGGNYAGSAPTAGTTNTGGGGGGGGYTASSGAAGGSGIVIVRYLG